MEIIGEKPVNGRIIGHRGWPARFPDNVLAGILAARQVAEMVEVDVRLAGDGTLVLSHDSHLGGLAVGESAWADLAAVDLGGGHRPIDLDSALAAVPGFPLNLEIKNYPGDPGFDPTHRVALETAARARPIDLLSCFYWETIDAVHQRRPEIATALLVDRGGSVADAVDHALAIGHVAVIPQFELALTSEAAIGSAVDAGLIVAVWTINQVEPARELLSMGVTGLITDDPGRMRDALALTENTEQP